MFGGAEMVFIGVDIDQIDKMAPRGVKSAPGAIELNRFFGAETDLLNLQCSAGGIVCPWIFDSRPLLMNLNLSRRIIILIVILCNFCFYTRLPCEARFFVISFIVQVICAKKKKKIGR